MRVRDWVWPAGRGGVVLLQALHLLDGSRGR